MYCFSIIVPFEMPWCVYTDDNYEFCSMLSKTKHSQQPHMKVVPVNNITYHPSTLAGICDVVNLFLKIHHCNITLL